MANASNGQRDLTETEIGAAGGTLRYWRAKEAVRQSELLLASQADARRAFEARISSLLGWVLAAVSLLIGGAFGSPSRTFPAVMTLLPLAVAGVLCAATIWPALWGQAGYRPAVLLDSGLGSEVEELESIAGGYEAAITLNDRWLAQAMRLTRCVYCLFVAAPFGGLIALIIAG